MSDILIARREIEFQLYEMLNTEQLAQRSLFTEHTKETFDAVLNIAEQIAQEKFVGHSVKNDQQEPTFDGENAHLIPEVKVAWNAFAEAGFLAAREPFEEGGMQLPESVMSQCMAMFTAANVGTAGYPFLTIAAAKLIKTFADDSLVAKFLPHMLSGRFSGTMALTEPQAGSSLGDITTQATETDQGHYLIKGNKIYISGGDQNITDNIVHMVLAKIKGAPAGTKGISLFLVPKFHTDADGNVLEKNDVALAGLFHKLGYRGTTSTALSFGEKDSCVGYLIGEPHQGLKYMFQMMNEARIGVGFGAAAIGYRGYQHALDYAKQRPQGRSVTSKDPSSKQINIIEHADVKRLLLAQKAYTEGALALCSYGARLVDDIASLTSPEEVQQTEQLLDLLTPIIKSWPSEYCVKANDLAIQVLGGAGYTREYPVEQCWRDNRLNPIHEGTNGIQAIDLMGRKIWQHAGAPLHMLRQKIQQSIEACPAELGELVKGLRDSLDLTKELYVILPQSMQENGPEKTLANADALLQVFGHQVVAWLWLKQASIATKKLATTLSDDENAFYQGKRQAAFYFFRYELPKIYSYADLVFKTDDTCFEMQADWF